MPELFQPDDASASNEPRVDYVVVARRYRPQAFGELIGQEHVARALGGAISSGRVGHAYLFCGARGVGKTSAARILAKALNCVQGPTPTPCNKCDICVSVSQGEDVDVLEIDGASNRGIDEIRQLRQNVNVRPSRARFKIYIIDEVHMLTREAFNALLKTLEEPPEHVKFIFCTTEPEKIPLTILSRCQRFDFAGIQVDSIVRRLTQIAETEGVKAKPEALQLLARRAGGSMRDSQSLLEQLLAFGSKEIRLADVHAMLGTASESRVLQLIDHLAQRNAASALRELDAALGEGVDVSQLVEQLLGFYRDAMALAVGCPSDVLLHVSPGHQEQLHGATASVGLENLLAVIQILDQTLSRMRYSSHGRILAEMALVRISSLEELESLPELIAQLRSGETGTTSSANAPERRSAAVPPAKKKAESVEQADDIDSAIPVAARSLTPESAPSVWQHVLSSLDDMLAEHAKFFERIALPAPQRLVVSFSAKYNSCKAFCERPDQRSKLEEALARVSGEPVRIEFDLLDSGECSVAEETRPPAPRKRLAEKMQHPLVRKAIELFDAPPLRLEDGGQ